jgi:hypothetical protein
MRSKKVWRHYCDYCRRAGFRKPSIEEHEKTCIGNPSRTCDICDLLGNETRPIDAMLKEAEGFCGVDKLKKIAGGCPVCMMAVIKHYNKATQDPEDRFYFGDVFDFKAAIAEIKTQHYRDHSDVAWGECF